MKKIKRTRRKLAEIGAQMEHLIDEAIHQRTCMSCAGAIPAKTKHLAYRYQDTWGFKRFNVCFFCTEILLKKIKKSFKKPLKTIRKERIFNDVIEIM